MQQNRDQVLEFLNEGVPFELPNGVILDLNLPTLADQIEFTRKSETLSKEGDVESLAKLPIEMLQTVTKGYNFQEEDAYKLMHKCGGPNGPLGLKVYSLYGIELKPEGEETEDGESVKTDESIPTE